MIVTIFLNTTEQANRLVDYLNTFDCDFDIDSGVNVVDGESLVGVMSMCIGKECTIHAYGDIDKIDESGFRNTIKDIIGETK